MSIRKIIPMDWVECNNPHHSRYGQVGRVTATQNNGFIDPKNPEECRVCFSDNHSFWINTGFLILRCADNQISGWIPGDDLKEH